MAFSLKMVVFGLGLTTFVTGVLVRRFELRWFDDVCNVGRPLVARPGPVATAQVSRPDLTCRIAETAPNFARNSPATISNIEFRSLELQRFLTLLKLCSIELRATFWGRGPTALTISHAIPSRVFHAVIRDRWNSADSNVLWGCAVVELHAELGSSLFRGRAIAQGHCTA